ncbi:MAG: vitamin B12-dependent ribonucleotide reductase, partial [Phycisphaeraceae bacterium]
MRVTRKYSIAGADPYSMVQWVKRSSRITNPDGSVVFEMKDAEVPSTWSQLATDIMVSKYFRKAGVPQDGGGTGPEKSARQVIHRLAGCWRHWGESHGYFDTTEDAQAFYDELAYMMVHQMAAPNSPQWFNTGLNWAYGITGPAQGHFIADPQTGDVSLAADAYTHPQPHACFIQSVSDDLVNEGGIMDLWVREARLFKYGSGTGTNFSSLRAENEPLSGGGKSSGLMSWLKIGDRAAGAIKSGGTTRRAAKMVCLDMDHPDIETFVNWKVREEVKVAAMVEGLKRLKKTDETIRETADRLGLKLDYDFNGEAYATVSGQNSNNSIRIPDAFFEALDADKGWDLRFRTNDQIARTVPAKDLWEQIGYAAWRCADPGVQYDSTINAWHTCPEGGRINASNPCVTGDTLVATETGLRRIRDMVGQSATIINGDGNAVFIDRIFKTGVKPVYELKTRAGYRVRLTADHRVKTANRGDVPACELTVDDVLLLEKSGFGDEFLPEAFGELLGAAVGDGCITRGERQDHLFITLGEHEREVARRLHENLNECKRWLNEGDGRGVRETEIVETQTGLRISTSVRPLLDRMRKYAVLDAGSGGKAFTDAVFGLDRAGVAATLRGLFTADGGVANYGEKSQYVFLDSTSLELLRQTQLLLLGFGIKAKIYENRRAIGQDKAMLPDGKGGMREYVVQQMHSLRISRASRIVFEKEIGFLAASAKARQLAELNQRVGVYADSMTDRVASLTACGVEEVFDLTEPVSHHFVANGVVVHNCSEYMFLDDTACNLASINLLKFYDSKTRAFDVEKYEHAVDIWTIVLEISVLMASFPSETIARKSYEYRTLGLGYANIGAMLMQAGIPYDSDDARALTGALTSIMCGRSYRKSAEMAAEMGPFAKYGENREHMLRVIRNHRRASKGMARDAAGKDSYERLKIRPVPIDHELFKPGRINIANAPELLDRSTAAWDDALALGEKHGYRNAQVTVIAPTGTIGLLMDCDTTGVEPDFALVKFKKLAGGGYFKIANASLRPALDALGYGDAQAKDIMRYVLGALTLDVPMPDPDGEADDSAISFAEFLREKGMLDADLKAVEDALPGVFELKFAFNAWTIGDAGLKRLGIDANKAKADPAFNLLSELGLTRKQIEALNEVICGAQTVEGAPGLKKEHLPVFDCASACGRKGKRFIAPEGHIRMMAAAQPFISGAISKTINLPNQASVEDIKSAYRLSWELGLKANALYRDGCKLSQPLSSKSDDESDESAGDADDARAGLADAEVRLLMGEDEDDLAVADAREESAVEAAMAARAAGAMDEETTVKIVERIVHRPLRRRLPDTRRSLTHKFNIAGHEGYLTVGLYEDGMPGELFITMAKEGSTIGGLMDSL